MINLNQKDYKELIGLLKELSDLEDEESRQAMLVYVGLGDLIPQINLAGKPFVAISKIFKYLSNYGSKDGCEVLGIFLEGLKDFVGDEKKAFLDLLLVKYNMMIPRVSPLPDLQSNLGEWGEERFDFQEWDGGVASRISAKITRCPFVLPQADVSTFTGREE
ncbi:hypothetical protein VB714_02510, partial [Spirulina sp. 06S082]